MTTWKDKARNLAIQKHGDQLYGGLPYINHLDDVNLAADQHIALLKSDDHYRTYHLSPNFKDEIDALIEEFNAEVGLS